MPLGAFRLNSIGKATSSSVATALRPAKEVYRFGNAQVSTAQSKFSGSSLLLDGTGDFLYFTQESDDNLTYIKNSSTGWTVEFFARYNNFTNASYLSTYQIPTTSVCAINFGATTAGAVAAVWWNGGWNNLVTSGITLSTNTWYHLAFVYDRVAGTAKIFVDGTAYYSAALDPTTQGLYGGGGYIGNNTTGALGPNVYIDEYRVSDTARYSSNFTAPTAAFTDDQYTKILLHFAGANGATTFTDDATAQAPVVSLTRPQNVQLYSASNTLNTSIKKFGTASVFINASTGGSYSGIQIGYNPIPPDTRFYAFKNFTIECWTYHTAWQPTGANNTGENSSSVWTISRGNGYVSTSFGFNEVGKITFNWSVNSSYGSGGTIQETGTSGVLNTWQHIALVKQGNTITLYVNGTSKATGSLYTGPVNMDGLGHSNLVNRIGQGYWGGTLYVDDFRMSRTARYTANFTAPTAAFTNDSDTVCLIHFDGANGATTFSDDNT
jgi:hypothetical protein